MRNFQTLFLACVVLMLTACAKPIVKLTLPEEPTEQTLFAAAHLTEALEANGYVVTEEADRTICLQLNAEGLKKEGFRIENDGQTITVTGHDGSGLLYGCRELIDRMEAEGKLNAPDHFEDAPEMVLRGTCIGVQKTYYLPGRTVYEYPYTPENFPWFYDKELWVKYLDMLVKNRMNSVYLWNGHPFASLVKLEDYPFAVEVDEETFRKNEEMFSFLTHEASKRGIFVIQMFYNILLSKPFAEHYGMRTQDRNRPITPLVADYTRKSIAAFVEKYPNVGLLCCLGEAMATYEDDVEWFTKVVLPGVKDGLNALGRTDEPPVLLRAHDTNCRMVMDAALPIYKNLYTMHKYNGESLTTYTPGGPWARFIRTSRRSVRPTFRMCIFWPTWSRSVGRRPTLRRRPCRRCTMCMVRMRCTSIRRLRIGIGPTRPTRRPTGSVCSSSTAIGPGMRRGVATPGIAVVTARRR